MTEVDDYKETEIGTIPAEWDVICLDELVHVKGGKRLPKGQGYAGQPTPHPYLRVTDFSNFSIDKSDLRYIDPDIHQRIKKYIVKVEDVFISIAGTTGIVGVIPADLDGANLTENAARLVIRKRERLHRDFLVWALASPKGQWEIQKQTTKTSQPKLALTRIRQIPIPLPPLDEQRRIAAVLSTIQEAMAAQESVIQATRELKRSLMHRLFTCGPYAEERPTKETEIGDILEHWSLVPLSEVIEFSRKPRKLNLAGFEYIPFFPMELLPDDELWANNYELRTEEQIRSGTYLERGDLLIAKITPSFENGKQGIVEDIPTPFAYATTEVHTVHPARDEILNLEYLFHYLKKQSVRADIAGKMEGSTGRQRVPKAVIENYPLPLPPLSEQEEIAFVFRKVQEKVNMGKRRMNALEALFKSMLHQLMTGRIRVPVTLSPGRDS